MVNGPLHGGNTYGGVMNATQYPERIDSPFQVTGIEFQIDKAKVLPQVLSNHSPLILEF